jgi:Flp pilus assembly CpaE family ATPase
VQNEDAMSTFKPNREAAVTSILVSPDRELANQFLAAVQDQRGFEVLAELKEYPSPNTLDIRIRQTRPEAVLVDVASNLESAIGLIEFLSSMEPPVLAVGLHWRNESDSVIRVLRAGASEFLYSPFEESAQREAVARLKKLGLRDRDGEVELGKVFVFTAAKPGAGTSTLATHAAHALRGKAGKRVLLVDLDMEGGSVAFYLKLQAPYSVADAIEHADRMDAAVWSALTVSSNGIDVLAAPEAPHSSCGRAAGVPPDRAAGTERMRSGVSGVVRGSGKPAPGAQSRRVPVEPGIRKGSISSSRQSCQP